MIKGPTKIEMYGRSIELSIPAIPPSVNHYIQHVRRGNFVAHIVTKEAQAWFDLVARHAIDAIRAPRYEVRATFTLGPKQRGDIDNFAKCLLDGLVHAGVIDTDARIDTLVLRRVSDLRLAGPHTQVVVVGTPGDRARVVDLPAPKAPKGPRNGAKRNGRRRFGRVATTQWCNPER